MSEAGDCWEGNGSGFGTGFFHNLLPQLISSCVSPIFINGVYFLLPSCDLVHVIFLCVYLVIGYKIEAAICSSPLTQKQCMCAYREVIDVLEVLCSGNYIAGLSLGTCG